MKHLKMLGLFAMAAAALMAFAGSASAATFTSPTGTNYTGAMSASLQGSALLHAGFADITCTTSTVAGSVTTNTTAEASGPINTVDFTGCGSATVDTLNHNGTLTITAGTHTATGTGTEVTVSVFGVSCVYGLGAGTHLGTATNTTVGGVDKATLDINAILKPISAPFPCSSAPEWIANYIVTTPTSSFLD